MIRYFMIFLFCLFDMSNLYANDKVIAVGPATVEKEKITLLPIFISPNMSKIHHKLCEDIFSIILADFLFYKERFYMPDYRPLKDHVLVKNAKFGYPDYPVLTTSKSDYVIHISAIEGDVHKKESVHLFGLHFKVYRVNTKSTIIDKIFFYEKNVNLRTYAHNLSDYLFRKITTKKSVFLSRLVFVSDKSSMGKETLKELYMMDYDGENINQITSHKGVIISPAASFDGKKVLYSLLKSTGTKAKGYIFLLDLEKQTSTNILTKEEIIMGAVFFPDGKRVALSFNQKDSTNIYEMNLKTKKMRKITNHFSDNVDPSISQDGELMAFLSGRSGAPMIYMLDPRGTELNVKRVSFQGRYNGSPHFSPFGNEIVFSSWLDSRFDLFRLNRDGSGLVRLTKDFGSNEGPRFSPDGEFIAFSSLRVVSRKLAIQDIYIANRDGDIIARVTKNQGHCITPIWIAPMHYLFGE